MNKLHVAVLALALGVASANIVHEMNFNGDVCTPGAKTTGVFSESGCYNDGEHSYMLECAGTQFVRIEFSQPNCLGEMIHQDLQTTGVCETSPDGFVSRMTECVDAMTVPDPELYASMRTWQDGDCDKSNPTAPSRRRVHYGLKDTCIAQMDDDEARFMHISCMPDSATGVDHISVRQFKHTAGDAPCTGEFEQQEYDPTETCIYDPNDFQSIAFSCTGNFDAVFDGPTGPPREIEEDNHGSDNNGDNSCSNVINGIQYHPEMGYVSYYCHPNWAPCEMVTATSGMVYYYVPPSVTQNMHPRPDCGMSGTPNMHI